MNKKLKELEKLNVAAHEARRNAYAATVAAHGAYDGSYVAAREVFRACTEACDDTWDSYIAVRDAEEDK